MLHRSAVRNHATYLPRPSLPPRAARTHATPLDAAAATTRRPARRAHASSARPAARTGQTTLRRVGAALDALCPAAILLCALVTAFVGLLLGLYTLLQRTLHMGVEQTAFPLLLGGTLLILLRGQLGVERYWALRKGVGLVTGHWTDHALALLYILAFVFAAAIVATLLACGASAVIGFLLA